MVLNEATDHLLRTIESDPTAASAAATPYLRMFGIVAGGSMLARAALEAQPARVQNTGERRLLEAKTTTARFYAERPLHLGRGLMVSVIRSEERSEGNECVS